MNWDMIIGYNYGVLNNKYYELLYGPNNGIKSVYIRWNDKFIYDDEKGRYSYYRYDGYQQCKSLYLSCLKKPHDNEVKDCFDAKHREIMKACHKYMKPYFLSNKE